MEILNAVLLALSIATASPQHPPPKPVDWCDGCKPQIQEVVVTPRVQFVEVTAKVQP